ncbi:unnamed protein product [Nesidiocoris tenuis]|uniref:Uncharacterized protein n=1 Tax=Nesidiocoris tenuis TaxID=355587 RepID=A0A6H5GU24_9HEMI|nr:unnamed protein product [Nesidiocoris tenuis]
MHTRKSGIQWCTPDRTILTPHSKCNIILVPRSTFKCLNTRRSRRTFFHRRAGTVAAPLGLRDGRRTAGDGVATRDASTSSPTSASSRTFLSLTIWRQAGRGGNALPSMLHD